MGGGDLNSKKSWHPNTMKNQERVWKAEQAAAEEKKRILELQRERAEERDRAELNDMARRTAGSSNDDRLSWMYDKPDKKAQDEDYLLGKSIEKSYGQSEKDEDAIPAVSRRVVGSSMLTSAGDTQVDLARKMREDPLLLVKERERAARAALLNNPLQRRRLTELLRKEQEQKKEKAKKKLKNNGNLDDKLAAKLSALGGEKTIDIAKLLDSGDSSLSDSDDEVDSKKKRKKKKTKKKSKKSKSKNRNSSDTEDSSSEEKSKKKTNKHKDKISKESKSESTIQTGEIEVSYYKVTTDMKSHRRDRQRVSPHRRDQWGRDSDTPEDRRDRRESSHRKGKKRNRDSISPYDDQDERKELSHRRERKRSRDADSPVDRRDRRESTLRRDQIRSRDTGSPDNKRDNRRNLTPEYKKKPGTEKPKKGLSEEEKAAKLAEMAMAGAAREVERSRRVRAARDGPAPAPVRAAPTPALPDSLEARIHSNRHYIQRDRHHMNQHFARR